jgi:hypothetical protein
MVQDEVPAAPSSAINGQAKPNLKAKAAKALETVKNNPTV